jgi:cytochrome c oxidase subunit 1
MSEAHGYGYGHAGDDHTPTCWRRWLYSTNHKDIGTMYLIFAVVFGIVGGIFSILMRMELQGRATAFWVVITSGSMSLRPPTA